MPEQPDCPNLCGLASTSDRILLKMICFRSFWFLFSASLFVFPEIVCANDSIEAPPGYEYSHGDEFSGDELNREMWALGINEKNIQNERVDCVYKLENISVENGLMIFTQKREPRPVLVSLRSRIYCLIIPPVGFILAKTMI